MSKFGWSYPAGCSGPPDDDRPDYCPVCRRENADEDGEPICAEAPDFCSVKCEAAYVDEQRAAAAADAEALREWDFFAGAGD